MKEEFEEYRPSAKTKVDLDRILEIGDEYAAQNIALTLRQIFYQLVAHGNIENTKNTYDRIETIVKNARYGGLLDWDGIHDRTRETHTVSSWKSPTALIEAALEQYRLPRTENQQNYVEVLVEKDALYSVLAPITEKYHIPLTVTRGYASATILYELSKRILREGKPAYLLYIGDHDPSGLDMLRDIAERVEILTRQAAFKVIPVALTLKQIEDERPPANFAKFKDSRAKEYIKLYGHESWEVDALRPELLRDIVTSAILKYIDLKRMNAIIEKEKKDKEFLRELLENAKEDIE